MKPPSDLPSVLVALGEAFARRAGIAPGDFWAYAYRQKAPPAELRAAIVEALFPAVSPSDFLGLPSAPDNDTLDTMDTNTFEPARRGRPHKGSHPLIKALRRENVSVAELAKGLGRAPSTVKSWYKAKGDPAARSIPRFCAELIRDRFGIPLTAWKHGIT